MLLQRIISAAILLPLALAATFAGGVWFFILVSAVALLASYEYLRLFKLDKDLSLAPLALLLVFLLIFDAFYTGASIAGGSLALVTLLALALQILKGNAPGSVASWALAMAGAVYIGWSAHHFVALRALGNGLDLVLLTFAITWICDTGAYIVGRWKGRHPFFPRISPKKTLEGAIGGAILGILAAVGFGLLFHLAWYHALILGIIGVLGSTFGDLAESVIKRQAAVKDSSNLIPGHGGMLDRIDSLLYNVVLVYYYVYWVIGVR